MTILFSIYDISYKKLISYPASILIDIVLVRYCLECFYLKTFFFPFLRFYASGIPLMMKKIKEGSLEPIETEHCHQLGRSRKVSPGKIH